MSMGKRWEGSQHKPIMSLQGATGELRGRTRQLLLRTFQEFTEEKHKKENPVTPEVENTHRY